MQNVAETLRAAREHHAGGRIAAAVPLYQRILAAEPGNPDANYLLGIALCQAGQLARSVPYLAAAARSRPGAAQAHRDLGIVLLKLGEHAGAEASLRRALALDPRNPQLLVNHGIALKHLGQLEEAAERHRAAAGLAPDLAEAHHHLGGCLLALGRAEEALAQFRRAAALKQDPAEALQGAAQALIDLGQTGAAIDLLQAAVAERPQAAELQRALGVVLLRANRAEEARAALAAALAAGPASTAAFVAHGVACERLKRFGEAMESYQAALTLQPGEADALLGMAAVLRKTNRLDEAVAAYDRAIAAAPERGEAYHGAGLAFLARREFAAAVRSFDAAIARMPKVAALHCQRARALRELDLLTEALMAVDEALALEPGMIDGWLMRAQILSILDRPEDALEMLEKARALDPAGDSGLDLRLSEKMRVCRWSEHDADVARLAERIGTAGDSTSPFQTLAFFDDAALQRRCAEAHAAEIAAKALPRQPMSVAMRDGRIAIGYVSGDFRDHASMYLMADLLSRHDRTRFRLVAFSLTTDETSSMRKQVMPLFDAFHDVGALTDRDIIALARREEIDIAADLMGYTRHSRPSLFAAGLAPVQVSYLGYPGTTGMPGMDYLIADPVVIPEGSRTHYSEKIAYLPDSYQPNDRNRRIAAQDVTREASGLPADAFVYCCFNNSFKITPVVFESWMRILRATPASVLWLFSYSPAVEMNLREKASSLGVDPARLIFATGLPLDLHLARHRAADLFLDTAPYNAHTTASDALWTGLPLLTLPGETFASRVAASLLTAAGLAELIASSREAYEDMAIALYRDRGALQRLKERLLANRLSCALFDSERYTLNLEALFAQMVVRRRQGLAPDHLFT